MRYHKALERYERSRGSREMDHKHYRQMRDHNAVDRER